MSHTTTIDLEIKDAESLIEAAEHLGFEVTKNATVRLYASTHTDCTAIKPEGWHFPIAYDKGELHMDTDDQYGERKQGQLNSLRQRYARNVGVKAAKRKGFRVQSENVVDGKLKLVLRR